MAEVIRMPLLSDTMKEGKIAAWLKKVGDTVKADDILAEVETDKATMEIMGFEDGTLLHIGVPAGSAAKIDDLICIIGKPGEDISALIAGSNAPKPIEIENPVPEGTTAPATASISFPKDVHVITMPLLSDTMKEGKIAAWLKNVGDKVVDDDVIAEVETDKATMEVIGYATGTLLYQGCKAGEAVLVNGTMAVVGPAGFDITPYLAQFSKQTLAIETAKPVAPPLASIAPAIANVNLTTTASQVAGGRIIASPLAKKIAADKGINLQSIAGSGDGGRIVAKDVENAKPEIVATTSASPIHTTSTTFVQTGTEGFTDVPLTQMRAIIAQRLCDSLFTAPHFYLRNSIVMDNLIALRAQINASQPVKVSVNDMLIKACAMSLRQHPDVNSSWMGDKIRNNHHIHIGTAIALPDGLIVPVLKFADSKSITQIALEANTLYDKAKNKKIQPVDFTGNTFTISNLGMMDIDDFTAIINPPDAAILAVGKAAKTPVVDEAGNVVVKTIMRLSLSCDHRVIDGAVGANFLKTLKGYLENPISMFV